MDKSLPITASARAGRIKCSFAGWCCRAARFVRDARAGPLRRYDFLTLIKSNALLTPLPGRLQRTPLTIDALLTRRLLEATISTY